MPLRSPCGAAIRRSAFSAPARMPRSWRSCGGALAAALPDSQQFRRVAAEDRGFFRVGEARRVEDVVHALVLPGNGVIGAEHDLARSYLGSEVPQRLGGEDERVEIEAPQVLRRLLLQL